MERILNGVLNAVHTQVCSETTVSIGKYTKKVKKTESFYSFYLTTSLAPSLLHLTLKNAVILAESKYVSSLIEIF